MYAAISRTILVLAALGSLAFADGEWKAQAHDPVRAPVEFEEPLSQDIEDLIARGEVYKQGYWYDHYGIWSVDPDAPPWGFDLQLQAWYAKLNGPLQVGGQEAIDIADVFGLSERTPTPSLRGVLWYERLFVAFDGYLMKFSNTTRVQEDITLPGGVVLPIDETIQTDFRIGNIRLALGGSIVTGKHRNWSIDLFLGVNVFYFDFETGVVDSPIQARINAWIPVPVLGVHYTGSVGKFFWDLEVSGLALSIDIYGAAFVDARASVGWRFSRGFAARVGFRYTDISAQIESVRLDVAMDGLFLQVDFSF